MHGCKEGQCAACKSFVLQGEDIELDRYSTFALPDYEKEEGSTLLCRAHAYEDLVIELLNYDEEIIRGGLPLRKGTVEVVANEPVTHDLRHLVVKLVEPEEIKFFPGQYMDFVVPGTDESRSFSMANTPNRDGMFEFVIKIYPGGLFSEFLAEKVQPGDRIEVEAPFGTFTLRRAARRTSCSSAAARDGADARPAEVDGRARGRPQGHLSTTAPDPAGPVLHRRAGRAGRAPVRFHLRPRAVPRPGRRRLGGGEGWSPMSSRPGRGLAGVDAYVCGPPPMVDAAIATLTTLGVKENNIHYDKFTTTGEPEA
jgi:propane monooxygenase reductase subunit